MSFASMKNKHIPNFHFQRSASRFNNSWEEQAFACHGAGPFGGFGWPPRSYTCSFCKRQFRSAQALGGHMNVHRKDRARLKQSLNPQNQLPCKSSSDVSYPSQVCFLDNYNRYSNPSFVPSPHQENLSEPNTHTSPLSSPSSSIIQDHPKSDCVNETSLGARLNLFISQNQLLGADCDEELITHKRHKASTVSSVPFFVKPCSSSDGLEDLDLELRLGDPPKVK